jgi:hypothetical protein
MLSKNQWLWCAEHHSGIKKFSTVVGIVAIATYAYLFMETFWWNNKVPDTYVPAESQFEKMNCNTYEVREMVIPSVNKKIALAGDMRNYVPDPLERHDARALLLENYRTGVIGAEILTKRPECLGAIIADKQHSPYPSVLLIVDRETGNTIFRIARLQDSLTR